MKKLLIVTAILGGLILACSAGIKFYLDQKVENDTEVLVSIKPGASLTSVAYLLNREGVIHHPRLFVKVGQLHGYGAQLKFGEYQILPSEKYSDVFQKMIDGETKLYPVTFVEGDHIFDYAAKLQAAELVSGKKFLELARDPDFVFEMTGERHSSLEGYLFPDTYHFSRTDNIKTIVKTMIDKFNRETKGLDFSAPSQLTRHQIVTLASIIEKETGAAFERPRISSVFHNRLKKKMRLQTDPTIIYGLLMETGNEINNIRKKDLRKPTAYNTYVIKGLPPGPIGNPGLESIKAAINPEKTDYLYFVSANQGTHIFTRNYKDHLKAVQKFQLNPAMRKGKSWRNLKQQEGQ